MWLAFNVKAALDQSTISQCHGLSFEHRSIIIEEASKREYHRIYSFAIQADQI